VTRAKSQLASTRKETPEALAAAKKQARAHARSDRLSDPSQKSSSFLPILIVALIGAAAAWFVLGKARGGGEIPDEQAPAAEPLQAQVEKPPEPPVTPTVAASSLPTADMAAPAAPEPLASAPPVASASAVPVAPAEPPEAARPEKSAKSAKGDATAPAPASAAGTRVVIVTLNPPDARLFYKGKSVGKSPIRIELEPGEKKRSFEVGRPGYVTRRLVVDGSESEISIGLRPDPNAPK
jgi:hypothetical protein